MASVFAKKTLKEKRNRGSFKEHNEARREEAEEDEEALLHREADFLHGKTKAKFSCSLLLGSVSRSVPLFLLGPVLVQVAPSSLFNSVCLAPVSTLRFVLSLFSSLSLFSLSHSFSRSSSLILFLSQSFRPSLSIPQLLSSSLLLFIELYQRPYRFGADSFIRSFTLDIDIGERERALKEDRRWQTTRDPREWTRGRQLGDSF